jgi:hypothetical protein
MTPEAEKSLHIGTFCLARATPTALKSTIHFGHECLKPRRSRPIGGDFGAFRPATTPEMPRLLVEKVRGRWFENQACEQLEVPAIA